MFDFKFFRENKNMKNKFNFGLALTVIIFVSLGCSQITDRFNQPSSGGSGNTSTSSNGNAIDKTIEDVADGETTGVPECDEVMKKIADQSNNPDDNLATKTAKDFFLGQIKKSLRESLKENGNDKTKLAEQCTDLKKSLDKNIKETGSNKK